MSEWQDISTAPKDGTEVLGFFQHPDNPKYNSGPWTMAWRQAFGKKEWCSSWDGSRVIEYQSDFGTDYKDVPMNPTHWQPLPPPPTP